MIPGMIEWAYALVQMMRRKTRRRDWKLKSADYSEYHVMSAKTALLLLCPACCQAASLCFNTTPWGLSLTILATVSLFSFH